MLIQELGWLTANVKLLLIDIFRLKSCGVGSSHSIDFHAREKYRFTINLHQKENGCELNILGKKGHTKKITVLKTTIFDSANPLDIYIDLLVICNFDMLKKIYEERVQEINEKN